jgi:hypothetical protein
MEKTVIFLDIKDNPLFIRILQILFGFTCFTVAIFWIVFNLKSVQKEGTLWITTFLLIGFGLYQIMSGFGKTKRYIEINDSEINLKKNALLPVSKMKTANIRKIESLPLNIIFHMENRKKIILRFGINYPELIGTVKDKLKEFAELNNIRFDTENDLE